MINPISIVIARRIRTTDLRGLLGNQLNVLTGQQAIIIAPDGVVQALPTGRQAVPGIHLFGAKPQMALVPASEFSLLCGVPYLLAGDKQRVDATFTATLRIGDASRCVGRLLSERETLTDQDCIAHITAVALPALSELVRAYTAADLCGPTPVAERVLGELRSRLSGRLAEDGLQLIGVRYPAFSLAQNVDVQLARTAQAGSTAELVPQAEQIDVPTQAVPEQSQLTPVPDNKAASLAGQTLGRLEARLPTQSKAAVAYTTVASERWVRFAKTFQVLSAICLLVTIVLRLGLPIFVEEGTIRRVSELFGALATLATAVAWFYARTQARRQRLIEIRPVPLLDRVSEHDRRAADRLVREQLGGELTQTYRTLKSAREKVYTQGHEQTALALGQTLKAIEALQKNIATPAEGAPAYLTQQRISLSELATMLDYDEDLLAESVALGDAAQAVEQASIKSEDVSEQAVMVLGNMEQLKNRFGSRSSFLRTLKRSSE